VRFVQKVGWVSGPVCLGAENNVPTGIRTSDRRTVASRYIDYTIPATYVRYFLFYYFPENVVDRVLLSEIIAMSEEQVW
jgi:hypothetical protein